MTDANPTPKVITVIIKTLTGQPHPITLPVTETISTLKECMQDRYGFRPVRIVSKGIVLENKQSLANYGIGDGDVVYSVLSLNQ